MTVDTHTTDHRGDVAPPATPPSGPVARIIAASLAAGVMSALVLTLVVFAGGSESAMTGSMMTALAISWALVGALTMRFTNRPQRWAVVPAGTMGVTGLALLALTPGNAALTQLSWVWPPVALALSAWTFVRLRRSLTGSGRWLLTPLVAVLGLAAVGATYENLTLRGDLASHPAPGATYDVGDHRLHLDCHGHGGPTVVLFNGLGEISASWARITGPVGEATRVCAYDRAGQGWSDDSENPQDGVAAAQELHTLLDVAGEDGPYVLVGHSIGGTYAMTYAAQHPEQVAGLVLLDSSSPEQFTAMPDYPGQYAVMRRGLALLPTLARLGLGHVIPTADLPAPAGDQVRALTSTARGARNSRDELSVLPAVFQQAQALTTIHGRPLAVVTASESVGETRGWAAAQDRLATLSGNRVHRVVISSHAGLLENPEGAAESVLAITEVVTSVRTGSLLETQ